MPSDAAQPVPPCGALHTMSHCQSRCIIVHRSTATSHYTLHQASSEHSMSTQGIDNSSAAQPSALGNKLKPTKSSTGFERPGIWSFPPFFT